MNFKHYFKWPLMKVVAHVGATAAAPLTVPAILLSSVAAAQSQTVQEKDLALLLPQDDSVLKISLREVGFSSAWAKEISLAYEQTSVGDAFGTENSEDEWQVVAVRAVPCQSFLNRPHPLESKLCWPEVRYVLQPIAKNVFALGRIIPYFADDRAIHVLFDYLPVSDSASWASQPAGFPKELATRLKTLAESNSAVDPRDLEAFEPLRDAAVANLISTVLKLRTGETQTEKPLVGYGKVGLRPEIALLQTGRALFKERLTEFLRSQQHSNQLPKEITAFSLPAGREPAHTDEWVFLQFIPTSAAVLKSQDIKVLSDSDGTPLVQFGKAERASMGRDDDALYDAIELFAGTRYEDELKRNTVAFVDDIQRNKTRISDSKKVRVANTSCASCHKLNANRFDFHNLSYFQELPMTISERVKTDVKNELEWLDNFFRQRN